MSNLPLSWSYVLIRLIILVFLLSMLSLSWRLNFLPFSSAIYVIIFFYLFPQTHPSACGWGFAPACGFFLLFSHVFVFIGQAHGAAPMLLFNYPLFYVGSFCFKPPAWHKLRLCFTRPMAAKLADNKILFYHCSIIHSSILRVSLETFAPILIISLPSVANGKA